jgi:hypothetical protein
MDLDFDELDRAVNSLIVKPSNGTGNDMPMVPASDPNITNDAVVTLDVDNNLPTAPVTIPKPVVERPSTGRFMDVVHPSSDMRTSLVMPERASTQTMPNPIPRPTMTQQFAPAAPAKPVFQPSTDELTPPIVVPEENTSYSDRDEDADIDRISNDIASTLGRDLDESPDSPFLPGTKVEKRPLGAFSTEPIAQVETQPTDNPTPEPESVNDVPDEKPAEVDMPLPAELQDDLLSIESDSTTQPEVLTPTNEPIVENPPVISNTVAATVATSTSIPQQYKEQPSSGSQNNGAIYDTNAYHKAIINPTNKKSGWLLVLWIVGLLIVGAGIGVAVYFLVLPRIT